MNETLARPGPAVPPSSMKTSGMAIASLVLGICSVLGCSILTAIPALILGGIALSKIGKSRGALVGTGQAIAGLVLGGLGLLVVPILAAILLPAISQARGAAQQASCMNQARQLGMAMQQYSLDHTNQLPAKLEDLNEYLGGSFAQVTRCPAKPQAGVAFELTGAAKQSGDPADAIVLREISPNHRGKRTVLFNDGHVEQRAD